MARMASVSTHSPIAPAMTAATIRIAITGSRNCPRKRRHLETGGASAS